MSKIGVDLYMVPRICLLANDSARTANLSQVISFSNCENAESDIPHVPVSSPPIGALFVYRRMGELHNDDGAKREASLALGDVEVDVVLGGVGDACAD